VDLSDWGNCRSQHTTGQSGQPMHKHYADMIQSWRAVDHHPMLFDRQQIEAEQEGTLILQPAGG
jgi:penicillin amidase